MNDIENRIKEFLAPIIRESLKEAMQGSMPNETQSNPKNDLGGIELAIEVTGLAKPTIYKLVSSGELQHYKKGGKLYFKRSELIAWIEEGKSKSNQTIITEINGRKRNTRR